MALIVCPDCGKEVSEKALTCIHCGCPISATAVTPPTPAPNVPKSTSDFDAKDMFPKPKKKVGCLKAVGVLVCAFIILCVIIAVTSDSDKPETNTPNVSSTTPTPKATPEIEYIEVTATELLEAYAENEISADGIYKGNLLMVTGTVDSIAKDILDNAYITLKNDNDRYSIISVQCYFEKNNLDDIAELKSGDIVTVTGKCDGGTFNVSLKKCDIVK